MNSTIVPYSLVTSYAGESLLSGFNWFTGNDPSNGFVSYQSREDATTQQLYSIDPSTNVIRLGVDSTNVQPLTTSRGRPSIRLESKESFTHGLFIADFLHMPPSQCGLWPAFWMYGSDWPYGGELDIIEGAHTSHRNIISAHTADGCQQDAPGTSPNGLFSGSQRNTDCAIGTANIGCGVDPPADDLSTYGDGFNAVGGGVYAVEWDDERLKVWHFPRGDVPADVEAKRPDPKSWGVPQAVFGGESCDVDSFFKNMSIVININFCGDYGDATWGSGTCGSLAPTCDEYVANNPQAFSNAYWDVKYIDAYQLSTTSRPTLPSSNNNTLPIPLTPSSIPVSQPPANPTNISSFAYLGCFTSTSNFGTLIPGEDTQEMTLERCVASCQNAGHIYAGVYTSQCYCGDKLDAGTTAVGDETACDKPCAGDASEFCGGDAVTLGRLLSVYGRVADEQAPIQPPPMARPAKTTTVTICPTATPVADGTILAVAQTPVITPPAGNGSIVLPPALETPPVVAAGSGGLLPDIGLSTLVGVLVVAFVMVL